MLSELSTNMGRKGNSWFTQWKLHNIHVTPHLVFWGANNTTYSLEAGDLSCFEWRYARLFIRQAPKTCLNFLGSFRSDGQILYTWCNQT